VHVLNNVTWQPLLECHHGSPVDEPADVAVYQEVEEVRALLAPPAQVRRRGLDQVRSWWWRRGWGGSRRHALACVEQPSTPHPE
jgi:hypothetical protein